MPRYIDAETIIIAVPDELLDKEEIIELINMMPTVDAVEVVRCKDCMYKNGKINSKGFEVCDATGMDITDNDFCSWGERKDE